MEDCFVGSESGSSKEVSRKSFGGVTHYTLGQGAMRGGSS